MHWNMFSNDNSCTPFDGHYSWTLFLNKTISSHTKLLHQNQSLVYCQQTEFDSEKSTSVWVVKQSQDWPGNMITKPRKDNLPQQFCLHVTRWLQCRIKDYICAWHQRVYYTEQSTSTMASSATRPVIHSTMRLWMMQLIIHCEQCSAYISLIPTKVFTLEWYVWLWSWVINTT